LKNKGISTKILSTHPECLQIIQREICQITSHREDENEDMPLKGGMFNSYTTGI
jgi:hypothetical protein